MPKPTMTAEDYDPEDAIEQFNAEVAKRMKAGLSRDRAVAAVVTRTPRLIKHF